MSKFKMSILMVLALTLMVCMAGGAVAEVDIILVADVTMEEAAPREQSEESNEPLVQIQPETPHTPVEEVSPQEQATRMFRAEFFVQDVSMGYVDVLDGNYLLTPAYIPELEGFAFAYWYDAVLYEEQLKEFPYLLPSEYIFGDPVMENLVLCAYFTAVPQVNAAEEAAETEPTENAAEPVEQPAAGTTEQAQLLIDLLLGSIEEAATEESVEEDKDAVAVTNTQAQDLINSILAADTTEEPSEDEIGSDSGLEAVAALPSVQVYYDFEGDEIVQGTLVTVRVELINIPEGIPTSFQWLCNAGGEFAEISQTGQSFSFYADETNTNCEYRVNVQLG